MSGRSQVRTAALVGLVLLSAAVLVSQTPIADAATREVTPQRYIRGACAALATWVDKTAAIDEQVTTAADALQAGKVKPKAAQAKVVGLYASATKASDRLVAATKATGTPKLGNGAQLAQDHLATLTDLRDTYKSAGKAAAQLSATDATKLYDGLTALDQQTIDKFDTIGMPLETLQADAALKPIIDANSDCGNVIDAYKASVEPTGFAPGDCVDLTTYKVVDCTTPHDGEVYVTTTYPAAADAAFPGNDTVNATVDKLCTDGFAAYVGTSLEQSQYTYTSLVPSADSWAAGDREVVCAVSNQDSSKMTGSVRGTAR